MTFDTPIQILSFSFSQNYGWLGNHNPLPANEENASKSLRELERSIFILENNGEVFVTNEGGLGQPGGEWQLKAFALPFTPLDLGDPSFKKLYGTNYALYAGSMANGIASEDLVIALGNAGFMGFFGSGGLLPERVEKSILRIQSELKDKPFGLTCSTAPSNPRSNRG